MLAVLAGGSGWFGGAPALAGCRPGGPGMVPALVITESPPACCFGTWAGSVRGTVTGVDTDSVAVVLYAQTDLWYVQPAVGATLALGCDGGFQDRTRGGSRYAALLVRGGFEPPATMGSLPLPGGDVLAIGLAPEGPRRIRFANRTWLVKASTELPLGPGPNLWSDSQDNVRVDAAGKLHLRLTKRGGRWYSAEVTTEEPLGHGLYRFAVDGRVDALDPSTVFAGFLYADHGSEVDIEFSRWGSSRRRQNAQFVVQPQAPHEFVLRSGVMRSVHEFDWQPGHVDFASRKGSLERPGSRLASWSSTSPQPQPGAERMHFNLWLYRGAPPRNGRELEVVVSDFEFVAPVVLAQHGTAPASSRPERGGLPVVALAGPYPNPSRGPVACSLTLGRAAPVAVQVFDVRGRLVQSLGERDLPAGRHDLTWDPGNLGAPLSAGVYYLRVDAGGARQVLRVILLQ